MIKTEFELKFTVCDLNESLPVIVVAAGSSSRMKGENKQLIELGGVPVIIKTLRAFEACACISNIILVVRSEDLFKMQMLCKEYGIAKLSDIVAGGDTRQESVKKGLERLSADCKKVLIHDGARPFVTADIIYSVVKGLESFSACAPAVKVKDTIKQVDKNGKVLRTVEREDLVSVQTPQGVIVEEYLKALKDIDVSSFTDDTSIMEAAGFLVGVVEGSYKNIKITTREDIALAKSFLGEEE